MTVRRPPWRARSVRPRGRIKSAKASSLDGVPTNSKTKLSNVESTTFARKISAMRSLDALVAGAAHLEQAQFAFHHRPLDVSLDLVDDHDAAQLRLDLLDHLGVPRCDHRDCASGGRCGRPRPRSGCRYCSRALRTGRSRGPGRPARSRPGRQGMALLARGVRIAQVIGRMAGHALLDFKAFMVLLSFRPVSDQHAPSDFDHAIASRPRPAASRYAACRKGSSGSSSRASRPARPG